jgi:hypothetical protein
MREQMWWKEAGTTGWRGHTFYPDKGNVNRPAWPRGEPRSAVVMEASYDLSENI